MNTKLFAISICLGIALIVMTPVAMGWGHDYVGPNPGKIKAGKTTQGDIGEGPAEKTPDGRFFFYRYHKNTPLFLGFDVKYWRHGEGRLLIEFDEEGVVKRSVKQKCKKKKAHAICDLPNENAMWAMIKELLGEDDTVQYRQGGARPASLTTALHEAVKRDDLEEIKRALGQGANVNARNSEGWPPLMVAATEGNAAVVDVLLTNGANVNAKDVSKSTPLHAAVSNGDTATVEVLLAKKADVNAKTNTDRTALYVAVEGSHLAITRLLLAKGAKVNVKPKHQGTPLHVAAGQGNTALAELLIANGAKVNSRDWFLNGDRPLHVAVEAGYTAMVELLIAQDADVNAGGAGGKPLHQAIRKGDAGIVELLLAHGANVTAKTSTPDGTKYFGFRRITAMELATQMGRDEVIELLKQHGAKK